MSLTTGTPLYPRKNCCNVVCSAFYYSTGTECSEILGRGGPHQDSCRVNGQRSSLRAVVYRLNAGHEYLDRNDLLALGDRLLIVLGGKDLITPSDALRRFLDKNSTCHVVHCPGYNAGGCSLIH